MAGNAGGEDEAQPLVGLPRELASSLAGGVWQDATSGFTGDLVFRVTLLDASVVYLKRATGPNRAELRREGARLRWLADRLAVPRVLAEAERGDERFLLTTEAPGAQAFAASFAESVPAVVRALAEGLQRLHALPVDECPFDARLAVKLARAEARVRLGLVDAKDFDDERVGWSADRVLEEARRTRPAEPAGDLVVTHGDYCLPNVLLAPDASCVTGYIDWGRAGVADRYQDLALALRSLRYNWGPGWEPLFAQHYGIGDIRDIGDLDQTRLAYYRLLDELF